MAQRGITREDIQRTLVDGWDATDAREGMFGKSLVFSFRAEWEGRFYEEKEVTVYYKLKESRVILLTAKARYGKGFPRGGQDED
ncbi:MAG: hypothetical protein HY327_04955 [Chloroflexi bacterium]|nr:hypothetical protein [Chloroflexota bacterium]